MKKICNLLKKLLRPLIIGTCLVILITFFFIHKKEDKNSDPEAQQITPPLMTEEEIERQRRTISLDMNGDGEKETVIIHPETEVKDGYIGVNNSKGEEIARSSEKSGTPPVPMHMEAYTLDTNDPREFLAMEYIAGPHQFQTMFMLLEDSTVYSIPKVRNQKDLEGYYFYITQDSLVVTDIDEDGFFEVCEIVSVYPSSGELSDDEEKAINEAFGEGAEDAKKIAETEQGQRIPAVWSIYSFNGKYFEPQEGKAYDRLFNLLTKDSPSPPMKKSEMSQSDIEYTETTRDFWNHE